jgi:hypothetical protein
MIFAFLLSTYEIWKVLVSLAKKNIAHLKPVLRLFIPKKQVKSEKDIRLSRAAPLPDFVKRNLYRRHLSRLK